MAASSPISGTSSIGSGSGNSPPSPSPSPSPSSSSTFALPETRISGYERDMIGYGQHAPHPHWPGNARIAVQFVINYEEGGENSVLHGDKSSEWLLSDIVGAQPKPATRCPNMESLYEYGSRAGFWRLHRMFEERKMPCTVYAVGMALERHPDAAKAMVDANWEIASHGYRWIDYQYMGEAEERAHIHRCVDIHQKLMDQRPIGLYQGKPNVNTRRLCVEEGGFVYDSDYYGDDLPFWNMEHGRPHLVIPYSLEANDMRFATAQGFNSGDQFFTYLKDTFDVLYDEGSTAPKMMSVGLHLRLVGRPGRAASLARFMDYVRSKERVWICRRSDIARHWYENFYPPGYQPSPAAVKAGFTCGSKLVTPLAVTAAQKALSAGPTVISVGAGSISTTSTNNIIGREAPATPKELEEKSTTGSDASIVHIIGSAAPTSSICDTGTPAVATTTAAGAAGAAAASAATTTTAPSTILVPSN